MPLGDDNDDAAYESLIKQQTAPARPTIPAVGHLPQLTGFAQEQGLTVGSTTNGRHNRGSKHYSGNAIDIKGSGGFSDDQVNALSTAASERGFKLRDERTRPAGQAVWGGPHIHLEYASQDPYESLIKKQTQPQGADPYESLIQKQVSVPQQTAIPPSQPPIQQSVSVAPRQLTSRIAQQLSPAPGTKVNTSVLAQPAPTQGLGELRRSEESAVANSQFVKAQQAKQAGAQAMKTNPMSAQARLYDPHEDVSATAATNQAAISAADEWRRQHQPEIDRQTELYRQDIQKAKALGGDPNKWVAEFGTKAAAGLIEPLGAVSNTARIHSEAAQRAAEEEGADRNVVSKFIQNTGAGLIGNAPEMAAMALGAPAIPAFAVGGGVRAAAKGQDVYEGAGRGALSGAAFEVPVPGAAALAERPVASAVARGATTGAATTGLELAQGQPLSQALQSGATAGLMSGGGQYLHSKPQAPAVEEGTPTISPELQNRMKIGEIQDQGGTVLNLEDVAAGGKPKVRVPTPPEPHHSTRQVRDTDGTFNGPVIPPEKLPPDWLTYTPEERAEFARQVDVEESNRKSEPLVPVQPQPTEAAPTPQNYPNVPETPETIQAQLDQRGYTLIPNGNLTPDLKGYSTEPTLDGTVYYDPERIDAETIRNTPTTELLGHVEEKSPATTQAVVARDADGNEVHASAVSPENVPAQVAKTQEQFPEAKVESGGPELAQQVLEDRTTSIKHAVVEAERELQGLPQFQKAVRTHGESFEQGVSAVRNGDIDPRALAAQLIKEPRPLLTKESMALLYDRMRISNAKEQAATDLEAANNSGNADRISEALDKVKQLDEASNANDEATYKAGSEQGRGLAIRRELINRDYSRAVVTAKLRAMNKGRSLPQDVQAKVDDLTARLEAATKRAEMAETKQQDVQSNARTDKFIREQKLQIRQRNRNATREVLAKERTDIKQQIAKAWSKQKARVGSDLTKSMGGVGGLDPEGELTRLVGKLARNYIEDGVVKATDLVDAVHSHIKDVADLTKREVSDLISGYGRIKSATPDPIERKLNEIKSILASTSGKADVLEKNIRAARRGQQREKPTEDQRRALRELQDAMQEKGTELAKKPYDPDTQQATPLDKAKTTTRNRIEQLKSWIASGKREVQGKAQVIPDAELTRLKAERAGLEKAASLIEDPAADQKAVDRRLGELNRAIAKARSDIQIGTLEPEIKEGAKSRWTPKIGAMERERQTLARIANDMRTEARKAKVEPVANFYGAEKSWAEFEAEARKTLGAQKSKSKAWAKQVSDLQSQLDTMQRTGQRVPKPPKAEPKPDTDDVRLAKRNAQKIQTQIDQLGDVIDWRNKNPAQKALSYASRGVKAGVLSGVRTLGKIGSALGQSAVHQYMGEGAGEGARKLFPRTSAMAARHGQRISGESEAAFAKGIGRGVKDIPGAIRHGETSLSLEAGKHYPQIPTKLGTILAMPGRAHAAEKGVLGSGEYERSRVMRMQSAKRQGLDVNNPDLKEEINKAALKDAEEIMMLGDNPFSRMVRGARAAIGKSGNDISRIVVPVERVPSNYLFAHLIGEFGLGLPRGLVRGARSEIQYRNALRKAVSDTSEHYLDGTLTAAAKELARNNPDLMQRLSPAEADKTLRLLKRGAVGAVYMTLGAMAGAGKGKVALGGFFGGSKDKREVEPGDLKVGPVTIPHFLLHSAPNDLANIVSTVKREIQSQVAEKKGVPVSSRAKTGAVVAAKGVARQIPFLNEYSDAVESLKDGDTAATQLGKWLATRIEPQIMQELAKAMDRENDEEVKRRPHGLVETLKMGVPGLRQTVPISKVFGTKASKGSSEAQRLDVDIQGSQRSPDESPADFTKREATDNEAIRKGIERVVNLSAYDKLSDEERADQIKLAKKVALENIEKPERPEKPEKRGLLPDETPLVPRGLRRPRSAFSRVGAQ